ncbi:MAG: ABC transporter permease [Clostridiales bacterium]|nr:ABC transporter permease [Eubacteriales bacterium]MCI5765982.1 ABC transporter permease [Clostridiales bacterium]MDD7121696.1 ABC transporter permease [Clostridiales bacterium]MDY5468015.1 ABC transporter permease [Eubacteriales bacterium]
MSEMYNGTAKIPPEKFEFVHSGERIADKKFEDKPIGYFKDAWIRFRKNHASVVATIIIICIVLFAFLTPIFNTRYNARFMDSYYAKKAPRALALRPYGIFDGGTTRTFSEKGLIKAIAIGVGAEDYDGRSVSLGEGLESYYQPMLKIGDPIEKRAGKKITLTFNGKIDTYLEVGFMYLSLEQAEYQRIVQWEKDNNLHVFYPLVENNSYNADAKDANNWYKTKKNVPVRINEKGKAEELTYSPDTVLEDNYKRDAEGNLVYYEYAGGGNFETAQYKVRVLYYNYYRYKNGFEPNYILGTDSQGYDLALRMAGGIKLSLLVAICVSFINFIIGAVYGAIEGYYGGLTDLIMERISDILSGVPFIIVATLFQIHLAAKVGAVPSLLFAFVLTGWIGTAARVRTQFYRFKNQEYVMAARTLGARDSRIIWKHIFPNSLGTIITSCALVIPGVINSESMLSYLGIVKLGSAGSTSLGTLLSDASSIWTNYPHLMIYPALILSLLMICFNLFGNGLRDAFNPSLRGVED